MRQWHNFLVGEDEVVVHNSCVEGGNGNDKCFKAFREWGEDLYNMGPDEKREHIGAYLDKLGKTTIGALANRACNYKEIKITPAVKEILKSAGKTILQDANEQVKLQGDINGWYVMSEYAVEDIDLEQHGEKMRGRGNPNINPKTGSKYTDSYDYQSAVEGLKQQYGASDKKDLEDKMTAKFGKDVKIDGLGKIKIGNVEMIWHHHQNCRNMQLIPRVLHDVYHPGGNTILESYGYDNERAKEKYPMSPLDITSNLLCKKLTKK